MGHRGPQLAIDERTRSALCLALNVDDLIEAERTARCLARFFGVAKVGPVLWAAAGPDAVGLLADLGYRVFLDLKLYDTPEVVHDTARVLASLGASYVTLHARGGVEMLEAGIAGLDEGAANAGLPAPMALAVTVLNGDTTAPDHVIPKRLRMAMEAGCSGVVCTVPDLAYVQVTAPRMMTVVSGIRHLPLGGDGAGVTAVEARMAGADMVVLGSTITDADDPELMATAIVSQLD